MQCSNFKDDDYFNSHAHVERDDKIMFALEDVKNFNSHAHVERDYCKFIHSH